MNEVMCSFERNDDAWKAGIPNKVPLRRILSELVLFLLVEVEDFLFDSENIIDALESCLAGWIVGKIQHEKSYRPTDVEKLTRLYRIARDKLGEGDLWYIRHESVVRKWWVLGEEFLRSH